MFLSDHATGILIVGFLSNPCASLYQYFFLLENIVSYPNSLILIKAKVKTRKRLTTNKMIPIVNRQKGISC